MLVASDAEENALSGQANARADQTLEVGLIAILAEAGHFPCGGHFDAEQDIRAPQSREGEDGCLEEKYRN